MSMGSKWTWIHVQGDMIINPVAQFTACITMNAQPLVNCQLVEVSPKKQQTSNLEHYN